MSALGLLLLTATSTLPPLQVYDVCKSGGVETGPGVDRQNDCPTGTSCEAIPGLFAIGGEVPWFCVPNDVTLCAYDSECTEGSFCRAVTLPDGTCSTQVKECVSAAVPCAPGVVTKCTETPKCAAGSTCWFGRCFGSPRD